MQDTHYAGYTLGFGSLCDAKAFWWHRGGSMFPPASLLIRAPRHRSLLFCDQRFPTTNRGGSLFATCHILKFSSWKELHWTENWSIFQMRRSHCFLPPILPGMNSPGCPPVSMFGRVLLRRFFPPIRRRKEHGARPRGEGLDSLELTKLGVGVVRRNDRPLTPKIMRRPFWACQSLIMKGGVAS